MKLATYLSDSGPRVAGVRDGQLIDLNQADPLGPDCIRILFAQGLDGLKAAAAALETGQPLGEVRLLAPVPKPQKIICIGLNYADHAEESGMEPPPELVVFNKFLTA